MVSKVTEYALMAFFTFISMIVLYMIYLGLINSQKIVNEQVENEKYSSKCNCLQLLSLTDNDIVLRNVACDYIENLTIIWPDYSATHNKTILRNQLVQISHESLFKENYSLYYPGCE